MIDYNKNHSSANKKLFSRMIHARVSLLVTSRKRKYFSKLFRPISYNPFNFNHMNNATFNRMVLVPFYN